MSIPANDEPGILRRQLRQLVDAMRAGAAGRRQVRHAMVNAPRRTDTLVPVCALGAACAGLGMDLRGTLMEFEATYRARYPGQEPLYSLEAYVTESATQVLGSKLAEELGMALLHLIPAAAIPGWPHRCEGFRYHDATGWTTVQKAVEYLNDVRGLSIEGIADVLEKGDGWWWPDRDGRTTWEKPQ